MRVSLRLLCPVVVLFSLLCISFPSFAQVTCKAKAPQQVYEGQYFTYEVTLNEKPSKLNSIQFPNFDVLSGPSTGSSTSISMSGGKTTKIVAFTYSYTLQPKKQGKFVIPAAVFTVKGKTVKSNAVNVQVLAETDRQKQRKAQEGVPNFNKKDVFVKASASKTSPFMGEQVIVTYKLYMPSTVNGGWQVTSINNPAQPNLWSYEMGDPSEGAPRTIENINGIRYTVFEIRKNAVFPQSTGSITLSPMELGLDCRIVYKQSSGDPFWDRMFGNQQVQPVTLEIESNKLNLNVKALPEGNVPESFTGTVGSYTLKSNLSRKELSANDATNLTLTISGRGNIQHIDPIALNFPPDFDVSEPKITDNINTSGASVSGSRTFEYVIIPRNGGEFVIEPAEFSFYDPAKKSYQTLTTDNFNLTIEGSIAAETVSSSSSVNQKDIKVLGNDIRFIKTNSNSFVAIGTVPFFASVHHFSLMILPFVLLFVFIIVWRNRIEKYSNVAYVNNKRAKKTATKCLKNAKLLIVQKKEEDFYIEISRALWGYLSHKYHIPLAQLSMETVEEVLTLKGASTETIEHFIKTLQQCEYSRFAPGESAVNMQEMYDEALAFILNNEAIKTK